MMNTTHADRIAALLRKAESTNHPEEAAAFTAKAQRLMLKYSIDQAMIDAANDSGTGVEAITTEGFTLRHTSAHARRLQTYLLNPATLAMGTCRMFVSGAKQCWLVGRPSDIESTGWMLDSLMKQCLSQMKAWSSTDPRFMHLDRNEKRKAQGQFIMSFGLTVAERLQAMFRTVTSETTGSELVLANRLNQVDAFIASNMKTRAAKETRLSGSAIGREEGRLAGQRANLGHGLDSSSSSRAVGR